MRPPPTVEYSGNDSTLMAMARAFKAYTEYLHKLNAEVASLKIEPGNGVMIDRSPSGTTISTKKSTSTVSSCAFEGSVYKEGESSLKFGLTSLGTVNNSAAENSIMGSELFNDDVGGENTTKWLRAKVTAVESVITGWRYELSSDPSPPIDVTPEVAPSLFYLDIGVIVKGRYLKVAGCGNITVLAAVQFTTTRLPVECGTYPFINHYTWEVTYNG